MTITIRKDWVQSYSRITSSRDMRKKRLDNVVHVSDIIPTTCIRKQYSCMKFPEMDPISNKSVHHFVRGESPQSTITLGEVNVHIVHFMIDL